MKDLIHSTIGEHIWIASHRGRFGGCIPENTLDAFYNALYAGADIVETDITKLADGSFILFHDETAERILRKEGAIDKYTYDEIKDIQLLNSIGEPSGRYLNTLDELLRALKGKCYINLDKCRDYLDEVYKKVLEYDMENQILLKNPVPCEKDVKWLKETKYNPLYVPVVKNDDGVKALYQVLEEISVKVVELFITTESDYLISKEFVEDMHKRGIKLWCNALDMGVNNNLCVGHGDDISLLQDPDLGWKWLIDKGMDIIQTDWVLELGEYLKGIGKR